MTTMEVFENIVAETRTKTWTFAPDYLKARFMAGRLMEWGELTDEQSALIADFLAGGVGEIVGAKKKIKQQRQPRKSKKEKEQPQTQHAMAEQGILK